MTTPSSASPPAASATATHSRARPANAVGIALVAASVLAYQIVLMRTFAIESYASFGSMVISIALLGFGLSGTLLTVFREAILKRRDAVLFWTALLSVPLMVASHFLQQSVPFVPGKMIAEPDHVYWLLVYYASALVPMFVQSMFIGVTLVGYNQDVHKLYFADLAASGVGAFAVLGLFYLVHPKFLLLIPLVPVAVAALVIALRRWEQALATLVLAGGVGTVLAYGNIEFNEYKGILATLRTAEISNARVIDERFGPHGYIQLVASTSERTAPGLSAGTPMGISPPEQHAVFVDGEKVGSLARALDKKTGAYLDWLISDLPYELLGNGKHVLALQVAGGEAMAEAAHHDAARIVGVTSNPQFKGLLETHADYTGRLLERPGLELILGDGRAVARQQGPVFDLVMLRDLDASGLSATSTPGLSETYPLTVEAFESYLGALKPGGLVAVTMRLSVPPYNGIRLIPTAAAALRAAGHTDVSDKFVFIRDTFLGLCLMKPDGFSEADRAAIRAWSNKRSFDISYMAGLKPEEINQYTMLPEETYASIATAVVAGGEAEKAALAGYMFDISATTDDRPYFPDVVRLKTARMLREYQERSMAALDAETTAAQVPSGDPGVPSGDPDVPSGDPEVPSGDPTDPEIPSGDPTDPVEPAASPEAPTAMAAAQAAEEAETGFVAALKQLPVELWSAYLQWVTLGQALIAGALIILIPMIGARRGIRGVPGKAKAFVYFACLGLGFMLAEMVLMRKLGLFLASPIFATTVVLAAILLFSGIGSGYSARFKSPGEAVRFAALLVVVTLALDILLLDFLIRAALGLPTAVRILIAVVVIAPTAFGLGFFFPTALETLGADPQRSALVPWSWAINGASSVVAAVLAEILSVHLGFRVVLGIAIALYALAWVSFPGRRDAAPVRS
ncbi:MAG: hypothetical protein IV100_00455 [Myxococcales bacterium]|nr:hypothetical protein [Myxococcales bacterium]